MQTDTEMNASENFLKARQRSAATEYDAIIIGAGAGGISALRCLRDQGLRSTAVTVIPDEAHSPCSPEASHRAAAVDYLKSIVDSCHAAGTEILMGPYHQPLGIFSGEPVTGDEWKRAAEVHR